MALLAASRGLFAPWTGWRARAADAAGPQGTVTILQGVDAESLDPHVTTSAASKGMMWSIYDTLFTRSPDMAIQPGLVTRYTLVDDRTWEFELRPNVRFHNGEPFDAEAVRFSFEHFTSPSTRNVYASLLAPVTGVEVLSPYRVRVHTSKPYALLLDVLASYCEMLPPKAGREGHDFGTHPIGTGPYRFVRWLPGERLELEAAAPHYSGRQPRMQRLVWRPVPESSTRVAELRTGAAQLISNVSPLQAAQVEGPGIRLVRLANVGSQIVVLNMLRRPEFRHVKVRQALNFAVDKQAIIRSLLRGYAVPLAGPFAKGVMGYDPSLEPYPYDPRRARQLLAEAGYAGGFEVTLTSPNGRYPNDRLVSEAIARMWTEVGVRTRVQTMEWGSFVQGVLGKTHEAFFFWQGGVITDATARTNFHSGLKGGPWEGYENPEVDRLIDLAPVTMDAAERERVYQRLARILYQDAPWVFLYAFEDLYGVSERLAGWVPYPDSIIRLGDMHLT